MTAHWEIEHGPIGVKTLKVNDEDVDINGLQEVHLDLHGQQQAALVLVYGSMADSTIKGEGIVMVTSVLAQSLDDLDASAIEAKALEAQGWGSEQSLTQTIIDIIKEQISGT